MLRKIGCKVGATASKGKFLPTLKAAATSPVVAVVLLGGIIGWQVWKSKKDAPEATPAE